MHIVHLAVAPDCIIAILLDLTDDDVNAVGAGTRDQKLRAVWQSYHDWCEAGTPSSDLAWTMENDCFSRRFI